MGQPHTSWALSRDEEGRRTNFDLPNRRGQLALAGVSQLFQTFAILLHVLAPFLPLHVPRWRSFQGWRLGGAHIHDTRWLHIFPTLTSRTSDLFHVRDSPPLLCLLESGLSSPFLLNQQIYFLNLLILKIITEILPWGCRGSLCASPCNGSFVRLLSLVSGGSLKLGCAPQARQLAGHSVGRAIQKKTKDR